MDMTTNIEKNSAPDSLIKAEDKYLCIKEIKSIKMTSPII